MRNGQPRACPRKDAPRAGGIQHELRRHSRERRRDPSLSTVYALAKGLRAPPGELLGPVKDLSPEAYDVGRQYDAAPRTFRTSSSVSCEWSRDGGAEARDETPRVWARR